MSSYLGGGSGSSSSGAPTDATYITQTANGSLSNEQAIDSLNNGFLFGNTDTGVLTSIASVSLATEVTGNLPVGNLNTGVNATTNTFWRGDGIWGTPTASVSTVNLSSLTTALQTTTFTSSGNIPQRWNFDATTDTTRMLSLWESTASTAGTSSSGVPNQVLLSLSTTAASTMSPLQVYSRGSHVFSVSPSSQQILAADGSAGAPTYSFAGDSDSGMYIISATPRILWSINGGFKMDLTSTQLRVPNGGATNPAITENVNWGNAGIYWPDSNVTAMSNTTDGEVIRFGSFLTQMNHVGSNTTSHALNFRKARAGITVITSGDDLATISGYGYVGATNTYKQAVQILFDTEGTINDTGAGRCPGVISFWTAPDVNPSTITEVFRVNSSQNMLMGTTTESSTLTINGGISLSAVSISAAYTVVTGTWAVYASAPAAVTVTLPAVSNAKGKLVFVKKTDAGGNAVYAAKAGGSADTIQGNATVTLASQYSSVLLHNDGLNTWFQVSSI